MRWICVTVCIGMSTLGYGYQGPPQAPPPAPAAAPQPATASIEGQVLHGTTGSPLKKASVRLAYIGRPANGGMPQVYAKDTDEQGRFSFTGLAAGRYSLSAQRQGFLSQSYGGRKYTGGTPIPLAADQHLKSLDLKLTPQSVIAGKVLDEDGEPVANVQVRAMQFGYRNGQKQWYQVGNGQTSDIGEYRIPNLNPGRYQVATTARQSNYGPQFPSTDPLPESPEMVYASTYYPSSLDSANAVAVDVTVGAETRGIDIRLRKTQVFRIRGRVMNAAGGRGNVMVTLTPKGGMQPLPNGNSPARPPDNRFEIRGVTPGAYILHAIIREGNQQAVAFQELQVGTQHIDNLVLTVAAGNNITGGVKVEDTTTPIAMPNLTVNLRPSLPVGANFRAKVDDGQRFVIPNVAPLHYSVRVSGVPETCFVKSIRYGGQEVPDDGIDLLGAGPIDVVLSATAGQVDAVVADKEGKPVASAIVGLYPKDGPMTASQSSSTDEKGAVTFKGLKPGEYRLIAWEDVPWGAIQEAEFVKQFESRGEAFKLDPSAHQAVQLKVIPAGETDK